MHTVSPRGDGMSFPERMKKKSKEKKKKEEDERRKERTSYNKDVS